MLNETLNFLYITLKESQKSETKSANSLYIIILYLEKRIEKQSWYSIIEAVTHIDKILINRLSENNGVNKLIRFFEDATESSIIE